MYMPITYLIAGSFLDLTIREGIIIVVTYVIFNVKTTFLAPNSLRFKGLPDFLYNDLATILALQPSVLKSEGTVFKNCNRNTLYRRHMLSLCGFYLVKDMGSVAAFRSYMLPPSSGDKNLYLRNVVNSIPEKTESIKFVIFSFHEPLSFLLNVNG
jgi:hypothetical protein